jgi:hypothetical protein
LNEKRGASPLGSFSQTHTFTTLKGSEENLKNREDKRDNGHELSESEVKS